MRTIARLGTTQGTHRSFRNRNSTFFRPPSYPLAVLCFFSKSPSCTLAVQFLIPARYSRNVLNLFMRTIPRLRTTQGTRRSFRNRNSTFFKPPSYPLAVQFLIPARFSRNVSNLFIRTIPGLGTTQGTRTSFWIRNSTFFRPPSYPLAVLCFLVSLLLVP